MNTRLRTIGLLAVLALTVAACGQNGNQSSSSGTSSTPDSLLASAPAAQKKFCAIIVKHEPSEEKATKFVTNQMNATETQQFTAKLATDRSARKSQLVSLLGDGNVEGWTAKVVSVNDATSNDVGVILDSGCDAKLEAVALDSELTAQTVIPKSSPLYTVVHGLKEGQQVAFSGHLIRKPSLPDGYQELSAATLPSLEEPRFNFKVTKLAVSQ